MRRWLKIAVPLGIAAVLVSVLALRSGGATDAETVPCASGVATAAVATFESEVVFDGRANSGGDSHFVRFCGEDTAYMQVIVNWKGNKDLRLTVIEPDGDTYVVDNHSGTTFEYYLRWGPLEHGDWEISVSNNGKGNAKYSAIVQFR